MRSISLIALLALVAHVRAEELASTDLDDSQNEELAANDEGDSQNEELAANDEGDSQNEEGDSENEELATDDSMDQFADMLMDKLADKLVDVGLNENDEDDQLDEDELVQDEEYPLEDDQFDEDELASVLGLHGGAAMKAMKAMAAMKAMKAMKAMAAMKAMKKSAMKVSKIAKGKLAKALVFRGSKEKTVGGLTKSDLMKNKNGKIVSKKKSALAKKNNKIKKWAEAVQKARKALGLKGFVAVKKGSPLYTKAKANYR